MSKTTIEVEVAGKFGARAFLSQRLLKAGLIPKRFIQSLEGGRNVIRIEAVGDAKMSLHAVAELLADHHAVVCVRNVINGHFRLTDKLGSSYPGNNNKFKTDKLNKKCENKWNQPEINEEKIDIEPHSLSGMFGPAHGALLIATAKHKKRLEAWIRELENHLNLPDERHNLRYSVGFL